MSFYKVKLEKLKSLGSLSRLCVVSGEGAGSTASSTRDQGRVLSTGNQADTWGNLGRHRAGQFGARKVVLA